MQKKNIYRNCLVISMPSDISEFINQALLLRKLAWGNHGSKGNELTYISDCCYGIKFVFLVARVLESPL